MGAMAGGTYPFIAPSHLLITQQQQPLSILWCWLGACTTVPSPVSPSTVIIKDFPFRMTRISDVGGAAPHEIHIDAVGPIAIKVR